MPADDQKRIKDAHSAGEPFEELYRSRRAYFVKVIARRIRDDNAAEEIVQEAFLQVSRANEKSTIDNPAGYLMRAAINLSTDWTRQENSRRRREKSWTEANYLINSRGVAEAIGSAPDRSLISRDELERVRSAVEKLSPSVRMAFVLHKIQGLSHAETAERMGLAKSTIEKHIMKAMRFIMDEIAGVAAENSRIEEFRRQSRQEGDRN